MGAVDLTQVIVILQNRIHRPFEEIYSERDEIFRKLCITNDS